GSHGLAPALGLFLIALANAQAWAEQGSSLVEPSEILAGVRAFFARTAGADGSFRPGLDPAYGGMSDSAYSDLAPVTYAVVIHKTFGWDLPDQARTRDFLLSRQRQDGAFIHVRGTADPHSAQARAYNTTQGLVAL